MMINTGCSRGGKRIDPRPRKQRRRDNNSNVSYGPPMPNVLQLNIEGLTQSKICVVNQLAIRHKAGVILLQETHTTSVQHCDLKKIKLDHDLQRMLRSYCLLQNYIMLLLYAPLPSFYLSIN